MVLSQEPRAKANFVTPLGKFGFIHCPFGLVQALAYFHCLVHEVLKGIEFAFGHCDNIPVYNPDMEIHLHHLQLMFEGLRETNLRLKKISVLFGKHIFNIWYI